MTRMYSISLGNRNAPALPAFLLLALTAMLSTGCCSDPKELRWRLLERHADPTGRLRLTTNLDQTDVQVAGPAVIVPGYLSGEMEVSRWTTYEATKIYDTCPSQKVTVVDPHGHPGVDADPIILPDQINGIPREPTGFGWTPLDAAQVPTVRIRWTLPDVQIGGQVPTGTTTTDTFLRFRIQISGAAAAAAARTPASDLRVHVEIDNVQDPVKVATKDAYATVRREMFVEANANGK